MRSLWVKVAILLLLGSSGYAESVDTRVGNGGDVAPDEAISVKELSQMVQRVRMQLLLYFNYVDTSSFWGDLGQVYSGLIAADLNDREAIEKSILHKTKTVVIHEESEGPCYDDQNNPKDGSASAPSQKTAICISTFNLSKKLTRLGAEVKLAALVAHEYAHLAGADEIQAQNVQRDVQRKFAASSYDAASNYASDLETRGLGAMLQVSKASQAENWKAACEAVLSLSKELDPFFTEQVMGLYSVANRAHKVETYSLKIKVENLVMGTCLQADSESGRAYETMRNPYNRAFDQKSEISVIAFRDEVLSFWPKFDANNKLTTTKIADRDSFLSELNQIRRLYTTMSNEIFYPLYRARTNQ